MVCLQLTSQSCCDKLIEQLFTSFKEQEFRDENRSYQNHLIDSPFIACVLTLPQVNFFLYRAGPGCVG